MDFIVRNKKTGNRVTVYKSKERDTYINANDCTTEYPCSDYKKV